MLAELCSEGKLIKTDGAFLIRNLSVKLSAEQERLINMLLDYTRKSGFVPFSAHTFWKLHKRRFNKNEIQRLLDYLHTQNRLICLNNRRFLTPQAIEQIKNRVEQVIRKNGSLRARAKITSHFGISSSNHFWHILKTKNLEIVHYYCAFCSLKYTS